MIPCFKHGGPNHSEPNLRIPFVNCMDKKDMYFYSIWCINAVNMSQKWTFLNFKLYVWKLHIFRMRFSRISRSGTFSPPALKFSVFIYTIRTFLILTHHFWRRLIEHDGFWELMWMTGHIILAFMIWIQSSIFMRKKYKNFSKQTKKECFSTKALKNI